MVVCNQGLLVKKATVTEKMIDKAQAMKDFIFNDVWWNENCIDS